MVEHYRSYFISPGQKASKIVRHIGYRKDHIKKIHKVTFRKWSVAWRVSKIILILSNLILIVSLYVL